MDKQKEIKKILGTSSNLCKVTITPDMARELLKYNTENRTRNKAREKEYIQDMKEGKFCLSESMIGFNKHGVLTNGQSRLYACVESGFSFQSVVSLELEQNIHMDTGRGRTTVDNIKLSKALKDICNDHPSTIKTVKTMLRTANNAARVRDEAVIDFCKEHAEILDKSLELGLLNLNGGKRAVFRSEIAAGFLAAAINNVDLDDLVYIRGVLTEGCSIKDKDKIILSFRDKALELSSYHSGSARKQLYNGVQHTIYVYTNNKKNKVVKTDSEYYPVI